MLLSEKHSRLRAHDDDDTKAALNEFVIEHFGGDHQRLAWFLDEVVLNRKWNNRDSGKFYSTRHGLIGFSSLREAQTV